MNKKWLFLSPILEVQRQVSLLSDNRDLNQQSYSPQNGPRPSLYRQMVSFLMLLLHVLSLGYKGKRGHMKKFAHLDFYQWFSLADGFDETCSLLFLIYSIKKLQPWLLTIKEHLTRTEVTTAQGHLLVHIVSTANVGTKHYHLVFQANLTHRWEGQ